MSLRRASTVVLRLTIGTLLLAGVFAQGVILPALAGHLARTFPEAAHLRYPLLIWAIALILCAEVGLISMWRLLDHITRAPQRRMASLDWVNIILWSLAIATLLLTSALIADLVTSFGVITIPIALTLTIVATSACFALVSILKGLLVQACALQHEMDQVV